MTFATLIDRARRVAIDAVFPPRCVGCGSLGSFLCPSCEEALPRALPPRCRVCWEPWAGDGLCPDCSQYRPAFAGIRSPYVFRDTARETVHALKYKHQSAVAAAVASLLHRYLEDARLPVDLIVPVPLHKRRERIRGYNQSALVARELGRLLDLPIHEKALMRRRNTASQAGTTSAEDRMRNVSRAFAHLGAPLIGQRVLLIDDVATTGATLDACARALLANGAAVVWALTFARED